MTSRERVLETLAFRKTDRAPVDLMDGRIWPELFDYFATAHGLHDRDAILDFLGTDFRWIEVALKEAGGAAKTPSHQVTAETTDTSDGPLRSARTLADVGRLYGGCRRPSDFDMPDFRAIRARWPDHAMVLLPHATPYFWASCQQFGMQEAFYKMVDAPAVYEALLERLSVDSQALLLHFLTAAVGCVDIVELWDDMAGQHGMMVDPAWWRRVVKPWLAREVALIHAHDMKVLFHSCGAVRPILPDLIDMGVDALEVFQINAASMEPRSIAKEFGGRLAFYGGIEVQHLLSSGTREEVAAQVRYNIDCFRECGGYIVSNCHSHIRTIKGENIVAMCRAAQRIDNTLDQGA
jgi:uroporphyrinogen decarboxylase